jgi:retron-type reverse transcriptase
MVTTESAFRDGFLHNDLFEKIVSLNNLLLAWREFRRGKRNKLDVQAFEHRLEDNLFKLHRELTSKTYRNDQYDSFFITDPKLRHIHKASVKDRVAHQAIFRVLYPIYEKTFISDSYSCRIDKGTHRGVARLERFLWQTSHNLKIPTYALKCDVKKFFDAVDHKVLVGLIKHKSHDLSTLWLIGQVVDSFETTPGKGLPLGNVTSQLFSNIYLNELDQFVKHKLKAKHYLRYCDDFVILSNDREYLEGLIPKLAGFLDEKLKLKLHERKIIIRKYSEGVDFLGYVTLPHFRILRTKTKHRMMRKLRYRVADFEQGSISESKLNQTVQSYLGVLRHCEGYKIGKVVKSLTDKK